MEAGALAAGAGSGRLARARGWRMKMGWTGACLACGRPECGGLRARGDCSFGDVALWIASRPLKRGKSARFQRAAAATTARARLARTKHHALPTPATDSSIGANSHFFFAGRCQFPASLPQRRHPHSPAARRTQSVCLERGRAAAEGRRSCTSRHLHAPRTCTVPIQALCCGLSPTWVCSERRAQGRPGLRTQAWAPSARRSAARRIT
jgi:hypothetical protein